MKITTVAITDKDVKVLEQVESALITAETYKEDIFTKALLQDFKQIINDFNEELKGE